MFRHDVSSQWIGGPRRVTVWTPEVLKSSLPLLILHDGQNLFEPDRAHRPGHHWQVAETAAALIEAGRIPPMAIAGVDHGAEDRLVEMTPTEGDHPGAGLAWRYGRFIVEELVPYLQIKYDVDAGAGRLAMGGSSLGGLVTLAIAQQYPARFGRLLMMSPSLWWDEGAMLKQARRQPLVPDTRVWLDAGNVAGIEDPEGDHTEDAWQRRLPQALTWLFGA